MQPYWRTPADAAGLSPEDRQALASNVMPPGASRAGRRSAAVTAKVALTATGLGVGLAAVGAAILLAGGDPDAGPGWPIIFFGGFITLLGAPLALGSALTKRKYTAAALGCITDTVVDVRRTKRPERTSRYGQPLEIQLASGVLIELPPTAEALGPVVVPGRCYRLWYLPAPHGLLGNTLVYIDVA